MWWSLALLISILMIGCSKHPKEIKQPIHSVRVTLSKQQTIPYYLTAVGLLRGSIEVQIKSQVEGQIVEVLFEDGQAVEKDQLLYLIDPRVYQADYVLAQAQLTAAEARHKYAQEFTRMYGALVGKEYVSRLDYEKGIQDTQVYQGAIDEAKANINLSQIRLGFTEIRSPTKGYIDIDQYHVGELVHPNYNQVLGTIRSVVPLQVNLSLPSQYSELLRKKQQESPLSIACYKPDDGTPLMGTIYGIDNTVNEMTGMIGLIGSLPNEDERGWPGEFVRVQVLVDEFKDAITVSANALIATDEGQIVFVVKEKEGQTVVEKRPVVKGITYEEETVILAGLEAGELVVTDGKRNLKPGSAVCFDATALSLPLSAPTQSCDSPPPTSEGDFPH